MNYLDFELEIDLGTGREYPVAVVRSPAGEAREIMRFPFDELALQNHLLKLQNALLRSGGKSRKIPLLKKRVRGKSSLHLRPGCANSLRVMPHLLVEKRSAVFQTADKMSALPTCN